MLGWKGPRVSRETANPPAAEIEAMALRSGVPVTRGGSIGMPAPVIDLDEMRAKNRTRMLEVARRAAAAAAAQ